MAPRNRFSFALLLAFMLSPAAAQVVIPPRVHWIGPEAECDYPSIQGALADIFNCGIFACPPGRNELHLSAAYDHQGEVTIDKTFDIRGGYASCQGAYTGVKKSLSSATAGQALFVVQPGSAQISNVLRDLRMFGVGSGSTGGVIEMRAGAGALTGAATLTLMDSTVTGGDAVSGGGVYLNGEGNRLELIDAVIEDSQAAEGGGIFCTNGGVIDFQSGFIQDNTAQLSGGGVYLQANCRLAGKTSNADRQILRNTVTDIQRGQGGGIFALSSIIEMGAINSRTRIEENIVDALLPLHDYDEPGDNRGGGLHLEHSDARFHNTWFRGNEAADGGAISAVGSSSVLVDRTSGPCHVSDVGETVDCSLFEFNRARGGTNEEGDEGGDGAVINTISALGVTPTVEINRSTWRFNAASCFEFGTPDLTGECDLELSGFSTTSIARALGETEIDGNLIYGNSIGDDEDCDFPVCTKQGIYFRLGVRSAFSENTVAENEDSDRIFSGVFDSLTNNVIWDFEPDEASAFVEVSSCNISNFADELNTSAQSIPIANSDSDPLFINSDLSTSPNEDFRVQVPDSPAIDRCDDAGGLADLTYDILGNPRTVNIPGVGNGPGNRDTGAFEAMPEGFVNSTTDLQVDIQSDSPKRAEISAPHSFTILVTNTGRNSPSGFAVELDFLHLDGTLLSLSSPPSSVTNMTQWNCDVISGRCESLVGLAPGGVTLPITAELSFAASGLKTVTAHVLMEDPSLTELTPDDNVDGDTVTVGPGADLMVDLISADPRQVFTNEPQMFIVDVTNNGPEDADDVEVAFDVAAGGGQIDSFGTSEWNCNAVTETCSLPRTLAGDPFVSTAFTLNVSYTVPGRKDLTATVSAAFGPGDPDPDNNADTNFVDVIAATDELFADGFEN